MVGNVEKLVVAQQRDHGEGIPITRNRKWKRMLCTTITSSSVHDRLMLYSANRFECNICWDSPNKYIMHCELYLACAKDGARFMGESQSNHQNFIIIDIVGTHTAIDFIRLPAWPSVRSLPRKWGISETRKSVPIPIHVPNPLSRKPTTPFQYAACHNVLSVLFRRFFFAAKSPGQKCNDVWGIVMLCMCC